jgi:phage tail sheath protein FI
MPEYLAPGVYVEEVDAGVKPIEGVSTSTAGFVGMTVRGPVSGLPVLVTSFPDFRRRFGGYLPTTLGNNRYLAYAVQGFFENGGKRVYVRRVQGSGDATAASGATLRGGLVTRLAQDALTNATQAQLRTLRGIQVTAPVNLTFTQVKNGVTTTQTVKVTAYDDTTGTATWAAAQKLTGDFQARYTTVTTDIANPGTPVAVSAADPGLWGNSISVQVFHTSLARAQVTGPLTESVPASGNFDIVPLNTSANFYVGAIVEFNKGKGKVYGKVKAILGTSIQLNTPFTGAGAANSLNPDAGTTTTTAGTCEFRIVASYDGVSEDYPSLTLDNRTPYYYATAINSGSTLISVANTPDNAREDPFTMPSATDGLNAVLSGGSDGSAPGDADFVGTDNGPGKRSGIQALTDIDEISIVAAPGLTSQTIQNALITHCELLRYRFAILDPAPKSSNNAPDMNDIRNQRNLFDTKYAALYYPRIVITDPLNGNTVAIPPSGHMAGIYARSDEQRGVHKAPANEVIGGITDLELMLSKGEQDILNPEPVNVNVLRDFRRQGRGLRVWGARCITSDTSWKYINVRRLFIFLEKSLEEGTQWVVFEPNDERLWGRVRQSIGNFLTRVWRDGALMGTKPEEAYFVKCDRTTMTQDDIDNGRLIILVGVAPVKPAEYVIIRIGQWAGGSSVETL